ncbi:hypothetical protein IM792_11435 [Mucilaginibacter sp. JRF]|uniref:hypothetical protein n=1 Tax=Mucilaginibacter sp. JRF TaxID=2780088 RepID=UPI001882D808|nr:hypothetical protein [Mucilaginibacter sp. JRF]MBE9585063.1 hypothetical protein [Mucilaginibacter sp. JRF]
MNRKLTNVMVVGALLVSILGTGCLKNNNNDVTPLPELTGNFKGSYYILKRRTNGTGFDTAKKIPVSLRLKADSGYTLRTDSTLVHANSNGNFAYDYSYIKFTDKTYSDTSKRKHLVDIYAYYYDGTKFQIARGSNPDTTRWVYNLTKTAN